jgi:hypothetical protein
LTERLGLEALLFKTTKPMTKEQFKSLKKDQEFKCENNVYKATSIHINQGIILGTEGIVPLPFRYENCELVSKDALVEYLKSDEFDHVCSVESLSKIRSIVRKEVIDSLKFPSYEELRSNGYDCFIEETKKLNR